MASRAPEMLTAELQKAWATMKAEMRAAGYDPILTCTHRSNAEQAALYAIGRTVPAKRRLTDAKPGQSKHNSLPAKAFDIAIIEHGKCNWDTKSPAWKLAVQIGERLGLRNLRKEDAHFEI